MDVLNVADQLGAADALQEPADQAEQRRVGFHDHDVGPLGPQGRPEGPHEETQVVDQAAGQEAFGKAGMPHATDADPLVHLGPAATIFGPSRVVVGLAGDDRNVEVRCEVFAQFGEKLSRCLRIGPVGAVEEEDAGRARRQVRGVRCQGGRAMARRAQSQTSRCGTCQSVVR